MARSCIGQVLAVLFLASQTEAIAAILRPRPQSSQNLGLVQRLKKFYLHLAERRICSVFESLATQHLQHLLRGIESFLATEVRPFRFEYLLEIFKTHIHCLTDPCEIESVGSPFPRVGMKRV